MDNDQPLLTEVANDQSLDLIEVDRVDHHNDDRSQQPQGLHRDNIRQALNKFKRGQELTEIRILRTDQGTVSGYFDDVEALLQTVPVT